MVRGIVLHLIAAVAVMMYGFGDDVSPLPETLDLVEDIVLDYAGTLMRKVNVTHCFVSHKPAVAVLCQTREAALRALGSEVPVLLLLW